MKIAQVVGYYDYFSPGKIWGLAEVAYNLIEELVRRGHQVTVYAPRGSRTSGKIPPDSPLPLKRLTKKYPPEILELHYKLLNMKIAKEAGRYDIYDIIHTHQLGFFPFAELINTPTVATLHNGGQSFFEKTLARFCQRTKIIAISKNAKKKAPYFNYVGVAYNGIAIEKYPFKQTAGEYLLWMGRMIPKKGALEAIIAAKQTKNKLILSSLSLDEDPTYWQQVKKHINGRDIIYLPGKIGRFKINLLKNARALLFPIKWEEPFGLVPVEAMACGTPVIAFRRGALPETVKQGKTGFLVNNTTQMIKAIGKINKIKRSDCRRWVENNFTVKQMTDAYEKIYLKILKKTI